MFVKRYKWNGVGVEKPHDVKKSKKYGSIYTDLVDNERWSESMGVTPEQIPEAVKTFPGSTYDSTGRLLIKNRKHKLQEMKKRGYVEFD